MSNSPKMLRRIENVMGLGLCDGAGCGCAHRCTLLMKSKRDLLGPPPRDPRLAAEIEQDGSISVMCLSFKSGVLRPKAAKPKAKAKGRAKSRKRRRSSRS